MKFAFAFLLAFFMEEMSRIVVKELDLTPKQALQIGFVVGALYVVIQWVIFPPGGAQ